MLVIFDTNRLHLYAHTDLSMQVHCHVTAVMGIKLLNITPIICSPAVSLYKSIPNVLFWITGMHILCCTLQNLTHSHWAFRYTSPIFCGSYSSLSLVQLWGHLAKSLRATLSFLLSKLKTDAQSLPRLQKHCLLLLHFIKN